MIARRIRVVHGGQAEMGKDLAITCSMAAMILSKRERCRNYDALIRLVFIFSSAAALTSR